MYTLIMWFYLLDRPVVVNVPGFTSRVRCQLAAKEVRQRLEAGAGSNVHEISRLCLEVR